MPIRKEQLSPLVSSSGATEQESIYSEPTEEEGGEGLLGSSHVKGGTNVASTGNGRKEEEIAEVDAIYDLAGSEPSAVSPTRSLSPNGEKRAIAEVDSLIQGIYDLVESCEVKPQSTPCSVKGQPLPSLPIAQTNTVLQKTENFDVYEDMGNGSQDLYEEMVPQPLYEDMDNRANGGGALKRVSLQEAPNSDDEGDTQPPALVLPPRDSVTPPLPPKDEPSGGLPPKPALPPKDNQPSSPGAPRLSPAGTGGVRVSPKPSPRPRHRESGSSSSPITQRTPLSGSLVQATSPRADIGGEARSGQTSPLRQSPSPASRRLHSTSVPGPSDTVFPMSVNGFGSDAVYDQVFEENTLSSGRSPSPAVQITPPTTHRTEGSGSQVKSTPPRAGVGGVEARRRQSSPLPSRSHSPVVVTMANSGTGDEGGSAIYDPVEFDEVEMQRQREGESVNHRNTTEYYLHAS